MKVIFISDNGQYHRKLSFNKWALIIALTILFSLSLFLVGNSRFFNSKTLNHGDAIIIDRFDSYLKRLATLEAQTQRLNALGARIAQKNNINIETFSLEKDPARGGFIANHVEDKKAQILNEKDFILSIKKAETALAKHEKTLMLYKDLSTIATNKKLLNASGKSGSDNYYSSPVHKGYISSKYGYRRDPINGKHRYHRGIDIAGRTGTLINSIASGFVSFTGWKGGYGKVVEIQHSHSLKSRYAHLSKISVKTGQVVRKGDTIAKMGSTGRVTGPHLHLEVWKSSKTVNPSIYLKEALGNLGKR